MATPHAPAARADAPRSGRAGAVMLVMFLLSGVAALIYQIVWAKQLALVFGVTIYGTSAVVTAFMAGLALGSLYFGRLADRWRRPLVFFALLEAGIGLFALLFPAVLAVLERIYVAFYGPLGESHYVMSLVRFALAFAVLLVPTSLMGGTLPVLSRAYVTQARRLGREVAGLYAANNLGAFVGCVAAGYALLELLGVTGTLALAAVLNVAVAAWALLLDRRLQAAEAPALAAHTEGRPPRLPRPIKVALWVFGIEGFTSLAYQMAWMRMLIFFVATNIYGITAVIATFLAGLSLGAFVVRGWVDRARDPYRMLGLIELGIGLTALATLPLLPWLLGGYDEFQQLLAGWGWLGQTAARFAVCFVVILVPTSFMGATLPVVSRIYVSALGQLGRKMGVLGCLDTLGSIFGAFAGGFILIPLLGIQRTIVAVALVNLALAAWVLAADPLARRAGRRRPALALAVVALLAAPLALLMEPLPLILARQQVRELPAGRVLYYHEDIESTVSVVQQFDFSRDLYVNRDAVAQTTRYDRPSHELIAHVPILLHPDPRRVLLIGYGIGFTTWSCRVHGVEVDVVELSGGVREANRFFDEQNNQILSDPAVHLRIDDGRNYALGTDRKYDVIQAGIIHPGLNSGNAGFYTVDFYEHCKRLLRPGGIVCQWLPLHAMPHADCRMLIRSFQRAFPHTSVWYKHTTDFCTLVGTPGPLSIDFQDVERRVAVPAVRDHLARSDVVDVYDLLDSFCAADAAVSGVIGGGPLHTDDHPYVEFHCNRPFDVRALAANVLLMGEMRRPVWPRLANVPQQRADEVRAALERWHAGTEMLIEAQWRDALRIFMTPGDPDYMPLVQEIDGIFRRLHTINPADENARFLHRRALAFHELALAKYLLAGGRVEEAAEHLRLAAAGGDDVHAAAEARFLLRRMGLASP